MIKGWDVAGTRRERNWSTRELIGRALWALVSALLFAWTPRHMWAWRRMILRTFGASIGMNVHIYPTVRIAVPWHISIGDYSAVGDQAILYSVGFITIGDRVTISQHAHLCAGTHDHTKPTMPVLKQPITIENDVWICADAFVGPGVRIGAHSIVGARAVAVRDVPVGAIVGGNPARLIKLRSATE